MGMVHLSNVGPDSASPDGAEVGEAERPTPSGKTTARGERAWAECPTLVTPPRLIAATRDEFRAAALDLLDRASAASAPAAVLDMGQTVDMDASGLGVLVLLHKRARERGLATRLLHTPEHVRRLLALTKLEYLFEYTHRAA